MVIIFFDIGIFPLVGVSRSELLFRESGERGGAWRGKDTVCPGERRISAVQVRFD
jgi:hypothetical protein